MSRLFAPFALILLGGITIVGILRVEPSGAAMPDVRTQTGRVVAGILGYARWPVPPATYRFCMTGEVLYLRDVQDSLGQAMLHPVSVRSLAGDEGNWVAGCDVLYIGGVAPAQRRRLLAQVVGKPVLTISEGDGVCADPSMFCLSVQDNQVSLLANLDAISRSGIRINPKVLQFVHRKQGGE